MSTSLLVTTVIILSEVTVILIALSFYLFMRLRKTSANLKSNRTPVVEEKQTKPSEPSIQTYIEDQIEQTTKKLEEVDGSDDETQLFALASRLSLLNSEQQIIKKTGPDIKQNDFWDIINEYYLDRSSVPDNNTNPGHSDPAMMARIKKLEVFKDLFINAQNKLKDSFDTINNLKSTISEMHSNEENEQIEDMVDKLSLDNINLHKQLDNANQQLKSILADAVENTHIEIDSSTTETVTEETPQELSELKEENDFLASQIQHLLQQEVENTNTLKERIAELEKSQEKDTTSDHDIEDLTEENEFLSNQIQFLLQQELQASKAHLDHINELENTIEKLQATSNTPVDNKPQLTEANNVTENLEAIEGIEEVEDLIEEANSSIPEQK